MFLSKKINIASLLFIFSFFLKALIFIRSSSSPFAMEKLEKELKEEFQLVSQEMDLISIKCIEVQRRLFEVTLTHHIDEILEPKKEEESSKESESKTQKRRQKR